jgi:hypothetical protein
MSVDSRLRLLEKRTPVSPSPRLEALMGSLTSAEKARLLELCPDDPKPSGVSRAAGARRMTTAELLEIIRPQLLTIEAERGAECR